MQLTKLMASEFTDAGIRVNSIAPGYFPRYACLLIQALDASDALYRVQQNDPKDRRRDE